MFQAWPTKINIQVISTSEIKVSCLIDASELYRRTGIHKAFDYMWLMRIYIMAGKGDGLLHLLFLEGRKSFPVKIQVVAQACAPKHQ